MDEWLTHHKIEFKQNWQNAPTVAIALNHELSLWTLTFNSGPYSSGQFTVHDVQYSNAGNAIGFILSNMPKLKTFSFRAIHAGDSKNAITCNFADIPNTAKTIITNCAIVGFPSNFVRNISRYIYEPPIKYMDLLENEFNPRHFEELCFPNIYGKIDSHQLALIKAKFQDRLCTLK